MKQIISVPTERRNATLAVNMGYPRTTSLNLMRFDLGNHRLSEYMCRTI